MCRKCKKERHKALLKRWKKEREERQNLPTEKECKGCHQIKPITEFTFSFNYKDGLHSHCKTCNIKKSKELKQKWKEERKNTKPPEEKLCTRCYQVFDISHFCGNTSTRDGFDNICKTCLKKQQEGYSERWVEERKTIPPKKEKTCPGCKQTLPANHFSAHIARKDGLNNYCNECNKRLRKEYADKWEQQRTTETRARKSKECNICHRTLPLKSFYPNRKYKDGHTNTCIKCEGLRSNQYIQKWEKQGVKIPMQKQCQSCKQILPADHFSKNKRKKDGLDFICKKCSKLQREQYNLKWSKERESKKQADFSLFPTFEKTCSLCHQTKPITMFYTRKNSKDGYNSSCKECNQKKQRIYLEKQKKLPKVIPKNKVCSACKKLLPASEFNKSSQRKDGLFVYCRNCSNKKHREYLSKVSIKK